MAVQDTPVVLVVDDEPDLADLYTAWLSPEYTVKTAYSGQEAVELLDRAIDIVLLDRRMPEFSGDDVLVEIRNRGLSSRVAMVTAIAPDFDILEMGFDDYLVKPVTREALRETVERLLDRKQHDDAIQRYYRLVSKQVALETEMGAEITAHPKYEGLLREIESIVEEIGDLATDFEHEDYEAQLFRIGSDGSDADADTPEGR